MTEYIIKPDYTMLSKESHGSLYKWNFGTDTEPECIVRCRDCDHRMPKGWKFDEFSNAAKQDSCALHMSHDFDYSYTEFFYVEPDDYCSRAKQRKEDE